MVVFGGWTGSHEKTAPLAFLCVPILLWAAFRFGARETATLTVILCGLALSGTLHGYGQFALQSPNASLLLLQTFMCVLAILGLSVAATVWERRRAEQKLLAR